MSTHQPNLGLLFDVDGPLASPVTRTVAIPSILTDLVKLARAGVPIAFITGRSDAFIHDEVVAPLIANGLANAFVGGAARMFGVFEKGAAWATIDGSGLGPLTVDEQLAFPPEAIAAVREIVTRDFGDSMFFDETKRAMISVEQRTDVPHAAYVEAQPLFEGAVFEALTAMGLGMRYRDREVPDVRGNVPYRVDPTIISTDIESVLLDKDRGAERAIEYFSGLGDVPTLWRTVGDSRSDYLMADHLHAAGYEVAHVDVRPSDGILERPYRIITEGDLIHDFAGAAFLSYWVEKLGL